jgi:glycosyltransferase involved in cell wall biosynthesis
MVEGAAILARRAADADVLYATGMYSRSAFAARVTGTPLVIKVVDDPAYERARNLGLFEGTLEEFQAASGSMAVRALKLLRRAALAQAARIIVPSRYLAGFMPRWGVAPSKIEIIPNPMPSESDGEARESLRSRLGVRGPTFVFAGRFVRQKNLPLAIAAVGLVPQANLVLVGDGPELARLHDAAARTRGPERVRFEGPATRSTVLDWFRAADAVLLPSDWENVPHGVLEALSVGTPVIATAVGGVPEVVQPQVNGLLIPAGDVRALATAIGSLADDEDLRARLSDGARATISRYRPEPIFGAIERVLEQAAGA